MERVRSVKVQIEVDTNKQTYRLDLDDIDVSDIESAVREFLEGLPQ